MQVVGVGTSSCQADADCLRQEDVTCALWEKEVLVNQTTYLIDIGPIKLFPTGTFAVPTCVINWGLIAILIIAFSLAIAAYKVVTGK